MTTRTFEYLWFGLAAVWIAGALAIGTWAIWRGSMTAADASSTLIVPSLCAAGCLVLGLIYRRRRLRHVRAHARLQDILGKAVPEES